MDELEGVILAYQRAMQSDNPCVIKKWKNTLRFLRHAEAQVRPRLEFIRRTGLEFNRRVSLRTWNPLAGMRPPPPSHRKPGSRAVTFVDDFGQSFKTCASLPQQALKVVGAKTNFDDGGGTDYVWGGEVALEALQPGDILQFKEHYQMMDKSLASHCCVLTRCEVSQPERN